MRRLGAAALATAGLLTAGVPILATAPPASAHTTLTSSDPASGAAVAAPPAITLTFADPVMVPKVVVSDSGGGPHAAGPARAVDNKVTQAVAGTLANGTYTVGWRVVAVDGHPVSGTYTFTVKGSTGEPAPPGRAGPAGPSGPSSSEGSGGSSGWLWLGLIAVVAALAAGGAAVVRRRR